MENTQPGLYSTRDITLAASLMAVGFKIAGIAQQVEGVNPREIAYFSFEENEALTDALGKYLRQELKVEPRAFMGNIRSLKSECVGNFKSPYNKFGGSK